MDATIPRRTIPGVAALLGVVAAAGITATATAGNGSHTQAVDRKITRLNSSH